ncbi:hypothetical protein F5X68DRAFT_195585 [Plectosphaerella plurivora]|uniref:Uncharacterized protein n=1 Tax=Plectosphaerella plurivora TaxID=936078 RepID=A0A9P8V0Z8_9PEZI|nr:hypothetical protein F5X68DRAFT_195585 [Plectosphaerella plurivora]
METKGASRMRRGLDKKARPSCLSPTYEDYKRYGDYNEHDDVSEAKSSKTRLSDVLPPTPITPEFFRKEIEHSCGTQDTTAVALDLENHIQANLASHNKNRIRIQVDLPSCRQPKQRRLILHSGSAKNNKSALRSKTIPTSKLLSPSYQHGRPTLHDLANAAEYHRITKRTKISQVSKKHHRIILKKTVLPRTMEDQIKDSMIKAHQAIARADKALEHGLDGGHPGKK